MRRATAAIVLLVSAALAGAQEAPPPGPGTTPAAPHPAVALGRRAAGALASRAVIPRVVVVPDAASYAEAIASWTPETIYPVLIDDGSWEASEDIARFVRAFRPESVDRWAFTGARRPGGAMRARRAVPDARELAEGALARSWGIGQAGSEEGSSAPGAGALLQRWLGLERVPPGVIVADERDPAWAAALALAAGRGQPILWTTLPKLQVDGPMTVEEAELLCARIEEFCAACNLPWRDLGDAIDAVTVCAALPARIQTSAEEFAATTDRLGRLGDGARWAWCGQVFGSEPQSAYRAMCSLFLRLDTAWLFDGYGSGQPWVQWDATAAARMLEEAGLFVALDDEPRNKVPDWRLRAERPVRADVIMVNSSGNRGWFDLSGGRAQPGDIPVLDAPSLLHMVHSWSAVAPGRRATVAGRWLERGVYAYIGSVHEPFLQAFVPTPVFAERLVQGAALGGAARIEGRPVWRIAVLADPLIARGDKPAPSTAALPLEDAAPVEESMKQAAGAKRYAEAVSALALLGRDVEGARLFAAVVREEPEALDADLARAALFPLFRTGMDDEFVRAYGALSPEMAGEGAAVDALWHVGRRVAREGGDYREAALTLMTAHMREDQREEDARELQALGGG